MSNTPVTSTQATWKTWATVLVALLFIAIGIPLIASIPDLGLAFIVAGIVAVAILAAARYIDPSPK